jgi:hypothetical protein
MLAWLPTALLAVLALPFEPFWPDYEAARRGVLLGCTAVIALGARRWLGRGVAAADWTLLALVAWHLVRSIGADHTMWALLRCAHWLALWIVFRWARAFAPEAWWRAALAVVLAVAAIGLLQGCGVTSALHAELFARDPDPAHWSRPWLWLQSLLGFDAGEPVSTLGNRNVASEFVAVGAAATCAYLGTAARSRWAWVALALAAAYLIVNGSRSGLAALPIAAGCVLAQRSVARRARLLLVSAIFAGLASGLLIHLWQRMPSEGSTPAAAATPSTLEVRVLVWQGTLAMFAEQPWLGAGSGQFAVHYPGFREAREIDLSSFGPQGPRSFAAAPRTAHNDHLEVLAETGVLGFALWCGFLIAALRVALRHGTGAAAPLVVFIVLGMVRSPLANAPAAALALGCTGALLARTDPRPAPWPACILVAVLAVAAAVPGIRVVAAQTVAADLPRDVRFPTGADPMRILDRAIAWCGSDPDLRTLRLETAVERSRGANAALRAEDVDADADALARLVPHDTTSLLWRAEAAHRLGQPGRALNLLQHVRELDPRDPAAALLEATVWMETGKPAEAIVTLYRDPHPRLRARLAQHWKELADAAEARGRPREEVFAYRAESAFLNAVDALRQGSPSSAALEIKGFTELLASAGVVDVRPLLLGAIWAHGSGAEDIAREYGREAQRRQLTLTAPHRRMLVGLEERLRGIPEWDSVLAPRP